MKLLTGSTGMIGRNLKELLPPMLTPTREELDLTNSSQVKEYLRANKPEQIIHCGSNDNDVCLYDNLRMFNNLAESGIPMIIFCTGREVEDRSYKNGEYVLSKHITKELALSKYNHISVIQLWGCFGKYERDIRFLRSNMLRVKQGLPIKVGENKLFSYVYVKDLARIIEGDCILYNELHKLVGYTHSLLEYAQVLKEVTESPFDIIVEKEDFYHSYTGEDNTFKDYLLCEPPVITPLKEAISEYWREFCESQK